MLFSGPKGPKVVRSKEELSEQGCLKQLGPKDWYTGLWPYEDPDAIRRAGVRIGADVVLRVDSGNGYDVSFYRRKKDKNTATEPST